MDTTALRVVARFQKLAASQWDGKFVGRDARVRWNRHGWLLEELPQKGKKKLRVSQADNLSGRGFSYGNFDAFIPDNILLDAKLSKSDTYDQIKHKLIDAFELAAERTLERMKDSAQYGWIRDSSKWWEKQEHYLKIEPEDTDPLKVKGKDFEMDVEWTKFKVYDPKSDFGQADPHYTMYYESSPTAARKLYQMVKTDPNVLKNVSWSELGDWFTKNKIVYKTHHSQWH